MTEIINYFRQVEKMDNIITIMVNIKTPKDLDLVVIVTADEYITPIKNMIEANFYTNRNLKAIRVKNVNTKEIMVLTTDSNTIKIKVICDGGI